MTSDPQIDYGNEIELRELFSALWASKWLIAGCALLATATAVAISFVVPNQYKATATVLPIDSEGRGSGLSALGSLAGQLGGLASLAGINLGGGGGGKAEALAVLRSDELVAKLITEKNLLPILYADQWDAQTSSWRTKDLARTPTLWKATRDFKKKILTVTEDRRNGLVQVTATWRDPQLAAQWANDLVALANATLRDKRLRDSERHLEYLRSESTRTDLLPVRSAINALMENEMKSVMVARGNDEFAFRSIDPALPPELRSSPQRLLWAVLGLALGGIVGTVVALVRKPAQP